MNDFCHYSVKLEGNHGNVEDGFGHMRVEMGDRRRKRLDVICKAVVSVDKARVQVRHAVVRLSF